MSRLGEGRPEGSKDKKPRKRRADVLNANREQWDRWAKQKGALAACRRMMLDCVNDTKASYRDRIRASEIIESRGYGRVAEEREQQPSQVLMIIRQTAEGYEQLNPGNPTEEPEIIDIVSRAVESD